MAVTQPSGSVRSARPARGARRAHLHPPAQACAAGDPGPAQWGGRTARQAVEHCLQALGSPPRTFPPRRAGVDGEDRGSWRRGECVISCAGSVRLAGGMTRMMVSVRKAKVHLKMGS